jgi:GT2 family glycosyltransferase
VDSVAVVVLNWNGTDDTLTCLESLEDQSVFVVDNASRPEELARLKASLPESVRLLKNKANLGFSGGCNVGANQAREDGFETLIFVNNDARLEPDCIEKLLQALSSGWSAVNPIIWHGEPTEGREKLWYEKGKISLGDFIVADHVESTPDDRLKPIYESDLATGCVLAIRTETFFSHGGFDEGLFAYFEDVDLSLKIRKAGGRCGVVREAEAWHKSGASSGGYASPLMLFYLFRNGPILTRRHASAEQLKSYRKKATLQLLAAAANFSHRSLRSGTAALRGAWAARVGHRGVAPEPLVPAWLVPVAWANFTAWKLLRPLFRKTPPKGTPEPEVAR